MDEEYEFSQYADKLQGYRIVKLKLKLIGPERHLFIKEHSSRKPDSKKPLGRTLYVLNVPPWLTEEPLVKKTLEKAIGKGKVQSVTFEPSQPGCGYKNAHVVFSTIEALNKALQLVVLGPVDTPEDPLITGLQKYAMEYNEELLKGERIDEYIAEQLKSHELQQKALKKQEKSVEEQEEEGGWTVVTKKGRNPGLARKESVGNKLQEKAEKKEKVLKNFYKHQIRESKQKALVALRENFEKEKLRAAKMKESRKFKPY